MLILFFSLFSIKNHDFTIITTAFPGEKHRSQQEPSKSVNPDEAVAMGAAIQAGVLKGDVKAGVRWGRAEEDCFPTSFDKYITIYQYNNISIYQYIYI